MEFIDGGVCAAQGFMAAGVHCGIRANKSKRDLSLIVSSAPAAAAAVYTTNLVKGAPLTVTKRHLANGRAQAIVCNSGNANTCNANGEEIAEGMADLVAAAAGVAADDVVVASTGVIGQPLSLDPLRAGIPDVFAQLAGGVEGSTAAAQGIMTTDTFDKQCAVEFTIGNTTCHLGGICKGSGMIHPNMATMLGFLTSDVAIEPEVLHDALFAAVEDSFNMVSVDGDTSTNDMVVVLANGLAGNEPITGPGAGLDAFAEALRAVTQALARKMAADGEGATKLLTCTVAGAASREAARTVAKGVICSSLVKAAMFGADANWGRVLCAIGYSGAAVDVTRVDVDFASVAGSVAVCRAGAGIAFSEETAKAVLSEAEVEIQIGLNAGDVSATAWGCDLTYDYVKINGDYRT